jgi:hypothetical protein
MGNAQMDFDRGVNPLDADTSPKPHAIAVPNRTDTSNATKLMILQTLNKRGYYFNTQIKTQNISPQEIATTFLTTQEITQSLSDTFNWIMGDVKVEAPTLPIGEGLYYLVALHRYQDAIRIVTSDAERCWNIKKTTRPAATKEAEEGTDNGTDSKEDEEEEGNGNGTDLACPALELYPLLLMACKAPGSLHEIMENPRLTTPFNNPIDTLDTTATTVAFTKEIDRLPSVVAVPCLLQDHTGTAFSSLQVQLVENPRRSFVNAVLNTYNHTLNELTEALELAAFSGRWDLAILLVKAITTAFNQPVETTPPATPEDSPSSEEAAPSPPPVALPVKFDGNDKQHLRKVLAMACGGLKNYRSELIKSTQPTTVLNQDDINVTALVHAELRIKCFDMIMLASSFNSVTSNLNVSDETSNLPPLYHAIKSNDTRMLSKLLEAGSIDLYNKTCNQHLPPCLYIGAFYGNEAVLQLLIPWFNNAAPTTTTRDGTTPAVLTASMTWGTTNKTPLQIAMEKMHPKNILMMLGKEERDRIVADKERLKQEKLDKEERAEQERLDQERLEQERLEQEERDRIAAELERLKPPSKVPHHGEEHDILVRRLVVQLNTEKEAIKFCDNVLQHKKKNGTTSKSKRILVVEDDVVLTFVDDNGAILRSKEFLSNTISDVKRKGNVITFKAPEKGESKSKKRTFEADNDLEGDELEDSLKHCIDWAAHHVMLENERSTMVEEVNEEEGTKAATEDATEEVMKDAEEANDEATEEKVQEEDAKEGGTEKGKDEEEEMVKDAEEANDEAAEKVKEEGANEASTEEAKEETVKDAEEANKKETEKVVEEGAKEAVTEEAVTEEAVTEKAVTEEAVTGEAVTEEEATVQDTGSEEIVNDGNAKSAASSATAQVYDLEEDSNDDDDDESAKEQGAKQNAGATLTEKAN